jgi:drug/metabolite transporter (DMT)-like permease
MRNSQAQQELTGYPYGFLGVLIFSLTLPATRMAVVALDPVFVGFGRSIVAAVFALILLGVTRQAIPPMKFLPNFCLVGLGVVIGFPLLSAIAMRDAPASYGAVIIGLLPLSTALFGVWRAGERPSRSFWIFAGLGSTLVISFALLSGRGSLRLADFALLGAVVTAGLGYAEGAVLSRKLGSWQVICWTLVLSVPLLLPMVWRYAPAHLSSVPASALIGFLYVSFFSQFLGYLAWYRGLSIGGIARIGQVQLIQPFLTILASALLLNETLGLMTLGFAAGVIACVALGKRARISTS